MDDPELDHAVGGAGGQIVEEGKPEHLGEIVGVHLVLLLELHNPEEELEEGVEGVEMALGQVGEECSESSLPLFQVRVVWGWGVMRRVGW